MKLYPQQGGEGGGRTWLVRCDECERLLKKTYSLKIARAEFLICARCLTRLRKIKV